MDLGRVLWLLQELQLGAVSASSSEEVPIPRLQRINNHVLEVCKPAGGCRPSVEVIFFHGLQLQDSREPFTTTWLSPDKSQLWLQWLSVDFPNARILTVSYDASPARTSREGRLDMHNLGENLVWDLIVNAQVGKDGCSVVLVGHCLGGLVIKELCLQAEKTLSTSRDPSYTETLRDFLENTKAVFYYGTPHHGSDLVVMFDKFVEAPLLMEVRTLSTSSSRRNIEFLKLRVKYGWNTYGVGEAQGVKLTIQGDCFEGLVVTEASAREDTDKFSTIHEDHFNICRPSDKNSSSYTRLLDCIGNSVKKDAKVSSTVDEFIVGCQEKVATVVGKLEAAQFLGIVGMGGIGKTILAHLVFEQVRGDYDYSCFLRLDQKSDGDRIRTLDDFKKLISRNLVKRGREVTADRFEWSQLKGKKVIIVLDDVWFESPLKFVAKMVCEEFAKKSRVLVTSRKADFLRKRKFEIYPIKVLDPEESVTLLCYHAFEGKEVPGTHRSILTAVVEKCGGLPLALQVLGSYLKNEKKGVWEEALEAISRAKPVGGSDSEDGLWKILKMSYDGLHKDLKEMFLDAATCFHGESLDVVKEIWRASGSVTDLNWKNLVDRCLVTEVHGYPMVRVIFGANCNIRVHDLLRDMARAITRPQEGDVSTYTRVDDIVTLNEILDMKGKANKVQIIKLNGEEGNFTLPEFSGSEWDGEEGNLMLPEFSGSEWDDLRVIWLRRVYTTAKSLPRRLVCLRLDDCGAYMQKLVLQHNPDCLRYLSITHTAYAERWSKMEGWSEIGRLSRLQYLEVRDYWGKHWQKVPESLGSLLSLRSLHLHLGNVEGLPDSLGRLQQLQDLVISGFDGLDLNSSLTELPGSLGQLQGLKRLYISGFECVTRLPDKFGDLKLLEELVVHYCPALEVLPAHLLCLEKLERLYLDGSISGCWRLESHSVSSARLDLLERDMVLVVDGCMLRVDADAFRKVSNALTTAPKLFVVDHHGNLLDGQSHLRKLKNLDIYFDGGPEELPECLSELRTLERLSINFFGSLEKFRKPFAQLQELRHLEIQEWPHLANLSESLGKLLALESLSIELESCSDDGCRYLVGLPEFLHTLGSLESLLIVGCRDLKGVAESLVHLPKLKSLTMSCSDELGKLPLGALQALESLSIKSSQSLERFADWFGQLLAVKRLEIKFCYDLEDIPESLSELRALESLSIEFCRSLKRLPNSLGELARLKRLSIESCGRLDKLPESCGKLRALESLYIRNCKKLNKLPESLLRVQGLKLEIS